MLNTLVPNYSLKWVFVIFVLLIGCSDSFDDVDNLLGPRDTSLKDPVNDFVWKGLNSWYYWQADSENLNDSKDDNVEAYYDLALIWTYW